MDGSTGAGQGLPPASGGPGATDGPSFLGSENHREQGGQRGDDRHAQTPLREAYRSGRLAGGAAAAQLIEVVAEFHDVARARASDLSHHEVVLAYKLGVTHRSEFRDGLRVHGRVAELRFVWHGTPV
jgi:hypothetical protein